MTATPPRPDAAFDFPSHEERARWATLPPSTIIIDHLWDARRAPEAGPRLGLRFGEKMLAIEIDAPFHGDPPPEAAPGRCPKLWEHEVVELFLLGSRERYLELEFGPHGHYLALRLAGVRRLQADGMTLPYAASIENGRWSAEARVPLEWLPPDWSRFNAYAIDGDGAQRRYWARFPVPGARPDFHRLDCFGTFEGAAPISSRRKG
ncbi:MAG TPA: hypothetical protein VMG12_27950 [Polyangiaceae bacterium]|nr:hypothetical protein [Polyangiaceae bacterium]